MTIVERAFYFADAHHGDQKYGNYTYMFHLWSVVGVAQDMGFNEDVQAACMLHDVLEDTPASYNDVKAEFGVEIADIVYAVTDELGKNRKERHEKTYPKIRNNNFALLVKFCDRIANVRYSKEHDKKMFKMYRKENDEFIAALTGVVYGNPIAKCRSELQRLFT
jgi:(p)ppGpp synthase/HD superfamily hydrolase